MSTSTCSVHCCMVSILKNVVFLQPLKEVNQEPAAMSDSTVKDKFTELSKAMSEQLVDFLMVCNHQHTPALMLYQITLNVTPGLCIADSCDVCQIRCVGSAHHTSDFSLYFKSLHLSSIPLPAAMQSQSTTLRMMKHGTDLSAASCNAVLSCLQAHGTCIKVSFIGTQPEKQGQGLGGQLIRAVSMRDNQPQQTWICCCWCLSLLFCMLWHLFTIALHMSACYALLYLHSCLRMYAIPYSALLCCSDIIATSRHNTLYRLLQSVFQPDRLGSAAD